nr:GAF and ANTAR domain-containing protein [Brevibacterium daeguense]
MPGFLNQLTQLSVAHLSLGHDVVAGIILQRNDRMIVVGSSDEKARGLEELQTGIDEGPCVDAMRTQTVTRVSDVESEHRWPVYVEAVRERGLRSILGVPLQLEGSATAALNFYSHHAGCFDEAAVEVAQRYAALASKALRVAVRVAELAEEAEHRRRAMESRTVIDVAVGILMSQNRCSQDDAFAILQRAASNRNIKVRELAGDLVASIGQPAPRTVFE